MTVSLWRRDITLVLLAGSVAVAVAMGVRQSFGVFLQPVSMDIGVGREVFAFAIALQNLLFGLIQPFVGMVADRYGGARVLAIGTIVYIAGLALAAAAADPLDLHLTLGVLVGLALSGTTYVVVLGAIGRVVPPERRSIAFGITTAAGSFGMFAFVPGAQALLSITDWRSAMVLLAMVTSVIAVTALGMRDRGGAKSSTALNAVDGVAEVQRLSTVLARAAYHRGYLLLNAGFFVCGFHIAFVGTHLPAYLTDQALSPLVAANALALIGLFNIFGSYWFGALGQRRRKKYLLSLIYLARAVVIAVFLILPLTPASALAFGAAFGFLWLATVPLCSGLVAQLFGIRYLSTMYGIVFLSHQLGAFLGAWLGGWIFDVTGGYGPVWLISIALGLIAAAIHLPIQDEPVFAPAEQPA